VHGSISQVIIHVCTAFTSICFSEKNLYNSCLVRPGDKDVDRSIKGYIQLYIKQELMMQMV